MASGSHSKSPEKAGSQTVRQRPGVWPPKIEPFVPRTDHNPEDLKSWARRTGFNFSGETEVRERSGAREVDLEKGNPDQENGSSPKIEIDPILGRRTSNPPDRNEIQPVSGNENGVRETGSETAVGSAEGLKRGEIEKRRVGVEPVEVPPTVGLNGNEKEVPLAAPAPEEKKGAYKDERDAEVYVLPESQELENLGRSPSRLRCGLTENPGLVLLLLYGVQHYLSLTGSLIFIPLIMVPAMGGTDEDIANVISTMLLVCGLTTIIHSYCGTRLPLVQGSSFVYLAPALVIINSQDFRNLNNNKFKHIMRELQGAILVGSIFQIILGYSGAISLLLRFINPVVVAPTVAAVGLAFFSYGFPLAGSCVEVSIPLILLVLLFAMYLRGIHFFGYRIFQIYAVPLSVIMVWAYAFFLTAGGAYNYKGCSPNIPSSNILTDACRRHAFTMKHCRTDVSNAWKTAAWVRIPYPFQWGIPTFHLRTSIIMVIVSLVASVNSVGSYHAASLLVNLRPPTPGIVSRGIGLEGFTSILAGLWGTGTGATTLTENLHTIKVTRMASRRAVVLGAAFMILFSLVGKVGAILASIPQALAASALCFVWSLIVALGLSTLQHNQTASSRNVMIVGFSLFISLSIPAYVQQYEPLNGLVLPSYFVPYAAASSGPVNTGNKALDYAINALLSLNMVIALLVAFLLDNTVPGSREERGIYDWSTAETAENEADLQAYALPTKIGKYFQWVKCLGC
ncbi:nucleobase-ascorbate transporter 11 [Aristolochia californica]|uniref:nucleobase-ascorbate transporter 11 n=1 Tax=Aristolochia californica TaxID=171875 RepID=UPI0035D87007